MNLLMRSASSGNWTNERHRGKTMPYCVIDTETSIKNRGENAIGDFKASPFHPDNKIVMLGTCISGFSDCIGIYDYRLDNISKGIRYILSKLDKTSTIIGHNIKFDLLYMMKESIELKEWLYTGYIWDT